MNKKTYKAYIELTKPSILTLVLVTTALGYYLGGNGIPSWATLGLLLLGAGLVCAGSSTLNHYIEREYDIKMQRTKNRPIPSGKIPAAHAMYFGTFLILAGITILYLFINILCAFLSLLTAFLYIIIYTPMKRASWLNTTFGAIPGAIPPLGGWAAATGALSFDAGVLFLILFIWQHPHFYAIAWMFKEDYARGGFKMLPVVEPDGKKMFTHIVVSSLLLIPVSILPTLRGITGFIYLIGALILGVGLYVISKQFQMDHSIINAKRLLKATVFYLPVLLLLIIADIHL